MTPEKPLQDTYAPHHICYGCGPANPAGLHIKSYPEGDTVVTHWTPGPEHTAFPGILSGGVIGMLFDCHSNWTAYWALINTPGGPECPTTVTAEFHVNLLKPTPLDTVRLVGRAVEVTGRRVTVETEMFDINGEKTATGGGTFVAVRPDHPLAGQW